MAESISKETITEFLTAARQGHDDELRKLLKEAPKLVNCSNDQGQTALIFASTFNRVKCCEVLFETNVDVNKQDRAGNTPLHFARDITVAQGLVERGASVTWKNILGRSPLHEACVWGEMQVFEELLSKFCGRVSEVKDKEGTTLLHLATISKIEESRIDKINLLLSLGTDVNEVNSCGRPAIVMACKNSDERVARYLVQHGADPNLSDVFGHNALHSCFLDYPLGLLDFGAFRPKSGLLKLLAPLMADVNVATATGMTALHLAAQRVKADDIRIILEAGANPLTRDNLGRTPLHFSMFNPFPEVFQVMLNYCEKGSDSLLTDDLGRSVLHYAAACASPEVFDASITCVAESYQLASEINLQDDYGKSPLHYFFMHGRTEEVVLESLLQNGAKVSDLPALTMATYSTQLTKSPEGNGGVETQSRNKTDLNSSENLLSSYLQEINITDSESVEPANLRPIADNREFLEQVALLTSESKDHKDIREGMNLTCETFMTALSQEVEKRDPRFTIDVIPSGSSYENTKLTGISASDFDYMTSLTAFNKIVTAVESVEFPIGYIMLKRVEDPEITTDLDFDEFFHDGYLIGQKVSERLCQLILEVLNDSTVWKETAHMYFLSKDPVCTWNDGSPAIKLNLMWTGGTSMPSKSVSCDVVPCLHIPGWWPSFARQESVVLKPNVKAGCYVVLKQPDVPFYGVAKFGNPECFLRVSFSPAELEIFRNMSENVRKSLVVAKALLKRVLKVPGKLVDVPAKGLQIQTKSVISTYLLKNALFHTLECFLEESTQDQDQLEYLVCGVFKRLFEYTKHNYFPAFFVPQQDLIHTHKTDNFSTILRFVASQALYYSVDKKEQKHSFEKMKFMLPAEKGKVYEDLHRGDKGIRYFLQGNEGNS